MMHFTLKHFYKLVILTCVVAILLYFQNQTKISGIIKSEKFDSQPYSRNSDSSKHNIHSELQSNIDRFTISRQFHIRNLKWSANTDSGSRDLVPRSQKFFQNRSSMPGNSLGDDPNVNLKDRDCGDVHKMNASFRCTFVTIANDCQIDEGFLNYISFAYCDFSTNLLPLAMVLLVFWWLFLFVGLAVTADDFFCPSLVVISDTMRLSHNVAGVTFLAFGNGAPDIFSAIAAIGNAKNGDAGLAIGGLFGAGVFVTTIVAGTIAIICPFDAMQRPFLRDIIFYLAATFWTFAVLWDKVITKLEAIGFILLYILYVLVVVVGRYIYTRNRLVNEEGRNIQDSSGREVVSPLDIASDGERQPLLNNPDIISLSAVRDQTLLQEFLHNINPIDTEEWPGMSLIKKFYEVFKSPLMFVLIITVPVVNYDVDKHHWNRHLYCIQCVLGPVFGVLATKVGFTMLGGSFPVWALTLILGVMLAAIVFFTSKNEVQPKYHAAFAYLGFVVAVVWIYSIANEIVNILQAFGVVFNISNAILGLTFLAWGNSIGDLIADTVMARQGFPRMGISACFGGPLFNLLLGIGIPFTIATIKNGQEYHIQITLEEIVLAAFLALSLISSLLIVPLSRFKMSRGWGIYLVVLYVVFLVIAILTETGVIHAAIDNNPN